MKPEQIKTYIESELTQVFKNIEHLGIAFLYPYVSKALECLNEPLRLAVVGRTKAGKSTLLNGLLGISFLPTGVDVTTYNVNVLHHVRRSPSGKEAVVAHLNDGTDIEVTLHELEDLVDNRKADTKQLRKRIVWADVYIDNPILLNMDIIDTPGEDDASNSKDITDKIQNFFNEEDQRPDVLAYAIRCETNNKDLENAFEYLKKINNGKHSVSALNVVVVFNGCDQLLEDGAGMEPMAWQSDYRPVGLSIIEKSRNRSAQFRKSFSKAFPTAAIYSHSACAFTKADFDIMKQISKENIAEEFAGWFTLDDYNKIGERYPHIANIFGSLEDRESLKNRLGLYSMRYMVWWMMKNPTGTIGQLRDAMDSYSNVPYLRDYIFNEHFLKLSIFYKASGVIPTLIKEIESVYSQSIDPIEKKHIGEMLQLCKNIRKTLYGNYGFLSILNDYYNQNDYFNDEEWTQAIDTISQYLSDELDETMISKKAEYWNSQLAYFNRIYNTSAAEATEKLIKLLNAYV